jgi:4-hydroxy-tetrahydrodipicolinate reductase
MEDKINVVVNGLSSSKENMAKESARYIQLDQELNLLPYSITGNTSNINYTIINNQKIELIKSSEKKKIIDYLKKEKPIIIDFTHPNAVLDNCIFYCENSIPFVLGTTGGDYNKLEEIVKNSNNIAIIAPNLSKEIVAFQAMMKYAAENFPGLFNRYSLEIIESHQKGKADTSGTAKTMVNYFNSLGVPFSVENIEKIRSPQEQLKMGIPNNYLEGHAWHTYILRNETDNILFNFTHNVNGRGTYAAGTIDAIKYINSKISKENKGKTYSMIDVINKK